MVHGVEERSERYPSPRRVRFPRTFTGNRPSFISRRLYPISRGYSGRARCTRSRSNGKGPGEPTGEEDRREAAQHPPPRGLRSQKSFANLSTGDSRTYPWYAIRGVYAYTRLHITLHSTRYTYMRIYTGLRVSTTTAPPASTNVRNTRVYERFNDSLEDGGPKKLFFFLLFINLFSYFITT